jgi:hypothetical protein
MTTSVLSRAELHARIRTGWHLVAESEAAWMAVGPTYEDLQVSDTGIASTQEDAVAALRSRLRDRCGWREDQLPVLADFIVHA